MTVFQNEGKILLAVEAFKNGAVIGLPISSVPQHIQTLIANLFFYENDVYKFYRRDVKTFNDLFGEWKTSEKREVFILADYEWNKFFSPDIYKGLFGLKTEGDKVVLTDSNDPERFELVIHMRRMSPSTNLALLLKERKISNKNAHKIGIELARRLVSFNIKPTWERRNFYEIMLNNIDDLATWTVIAHPYLDREESGALLTALRKVINVKKNEWQDLSQSNFLVTIDDHASNLFFDVAEVYFLDVYIPNIRWRAAPAFYTFFRLSADFAILGSRELADEFLEGCRKIIPFDMTDKETRLINEIHAALIKTAMSFKLYIDGDIQQKEDGERYLSFLRKSISKLTLN